MEKLFIGFLGTLLVLTPFINAALPPLYESLNEYKALITSPQLAEKLGSAEEIQDIQREGNGFIIHSTKKTLKVDVVYEPMQHPGPAKFHLEFHDPENA